MGISDVIERAAEAFLQIPGVVGVGETDSDGQPSVLVMVTHLTPDMKRALPESIGGYPVKLDITGPIAAQPDA